MANQCTSCQCFKQILDIAIHSIHYNEYVFLISYHTQSHISKILSIIAGTVQRDLQVEVLLWGRSDPSPGAPWDLLDVRNTSETIACDGECSSSVIIDDQDLKYNYYQVCK